MNLHKHVMCKICNIMDRTFYENCFEPLMRKTLIFVINFHILCQVFSAKDEKLWSGARICKENSLTPTLLFSQLSFSLALLHDVIPSKAVLLRDGNFIFTTNLPLPNLLFWCDRAKRVVSFTRRGPHFPFVVAIVDIVGGFDLRSVSNFCWYHE